MIPFEGGQHGHEPAQRIPGNLVTKADRHVDIGEVGVAEGGFIKLQHLPRLLHPRAMS